MNSVQRLDTREVVLTFFKALQSGDAPQMRIMFSHDATWWLSGELPTSGYWTGPDQIIDEFLASMFAQLDQNAPVTQQLHRLIVDGDLAVAEWTSSATTADHQPYKNDYAVVFEVAAGLIVRIREYFDTAYAQRVMFGGPEQAIPPAPRRGPE